MQSGGTPSLIAFVLAASAGACQFERDLVGVGYYGTARAGRGASEVSPTPPPQAQPPEAEAAGRSAGQGGATGAPSQVGAAGGMGAMTPAEPGSAGSTAPEAGGTSADCDMTGRWLSTVHLTNDTLGNLQYAYSYIYYEIEQSGEGFEVTKGIYCGESTLGVGAFAISLDSRAAWPAFRTKVRFEGRSGTSVKEADGCRIDLERWYTVRGATVPHYLDPAIPLPSAENEATDSTPGWEDWDNDGNPGFTGVLSGTVTGKIFLAPRQWTQLSGTAASLDGVVNLLAQWGSEQNVMAYDGSPLLASESAKSADPRAHFAEFVRLTTDQAAGDDDEICDRIIELAPMLTPAATGE
jgi:hypothetical protein